MKHTGTPWLIDHNNCHAGQIATLHGDDDGYAEIWSEQWAHDAHKSQDANARRIVACVNACAGVSDEQLEQLRILLRQRDELLEVCKLAQAMLSDAQLCETGEKCNLPALDDAIARMATSS